MHITFGDLRIIVCTRTDKFCFCMVQRLKVNVHDFLPVKNVLVRIKACNSLCNNTTEAHLPSSLRVTKLPAPKAVAIN